MLANTLTFGGATLTKIQEGNYESEYFYRSTTDMYRLKVRHLEVKAKGVEPPKERHNVEVVRTVFATDTAPQKVDKTYIVIEQQSDSVSAELALLLMAMLSASSGAILTQIVGWES